MSKAANLHNRRLAYRIPTRFGEIIGELPVTGIPAPLSRLFAYAASIGEAAAVLARVKNQTPASCRKGCSACCRQPVPISPPEAFHLAEVMEGLPRAHRLRVLRRMRVSARRWRKVHPGDGPLSSGKEYFELEMSCPFLEDQACSIHPDWPLVCREYLVGSDPDHCREFSNPSIRMLPIPLPVREALGKVGSALLGMASSEIPLIFLQEWLNELGEMGELRFSEDEMAKRLIYELGGTIEI